MRVVVTGDVGWPDFYHTGDEAMTEVAVDLLGEGGVDEVVLVSANPALTTQQSGCEAVPRIGFSKSWNQDRLDQRLAALDTVLAGGEPSGEISPDTIAAVAGADALLIAGGGNLCSEYRYMIYERLALVRIAKQYGRPIFITSQTVGPMLEPADEILVKEIADSATWFGAREPATAALVRELVAEPARVVSTMDDTVLLEPEPNDVAHLASLGLPQRYVVASFTHYTGLTGLSATEYQTCLAGLMDDLAQRLDADVMLAPHCGSFNPEVVTYDRASDEGVVAASAGGRVRALPMLTARQVIALTRGAILSVSTRYHAAVFATSQGVPALGLVTDYYSSVRMGGALGNVGLRPFAMPVDPQNTSVVIAAIEDIAGHEAQLRDHLRQVGSIRRSEQRAWWGALTSALRGDSGGPAPADLSEVPAFVCGDWRLRAAETTVFAEQSWRHQVAHGRTQVDHAKTQVDHAKTQQALAAAGRDADGLRIQLAAERAETARLTEQLTTVRTQATELRKQLKASERELQKTRSRLERILRNPVIRVVQRLRRLTKW